MSGQRGKVDVRTTDLRSALEQASAWGFRLLTIGVTQFARARFDRDSKKAATVSDKTLMQIVERNKDTEYGRKYSFDTIETAEDFRSRVPVVSYPDIEPYVDEMATQAKTNVLSADEVDHFMLTSGTTSKPKLIPTTKIERQRRIPFFVFIPQGTIARELGISTLMGRGMNGMSIAATNKETAAGTPISSSLRIGLGERARLLEMVFSSPAEAFAVRDVASAYYLHWLFALTDRKLRYVSDEFASKMAFSLSVLTGRHEELADDLEAGRINADLDLPDDVREGLSDQLTPDPERATEVRAVFAATPGFEGILPKLWPGLRYVACIYTGTFSVYEQAVRRFSGSLPLFNVGYGMSEACIATSIGPDDPRYVLYPRAGYLEFIKESDVEEEDPQTHTLSDLEVGENYEIVVTNFGGLYRYRTADVVEVVDFQGEAPVIEFRHRANVLMNFNAEMMTEDVAFGALADAATDIGCRIVDYTIRPGTETFPPHYSYFVEFAEEITAEQHEQLNEAVEQHLYERNPRYEDRVRMGRLLPARVHVVEPGAFSDFELFLGERAQENGISHVQTKVPRLLKSEELIEVLDLRVVHRSEHPEAVG